MKFIQNKYLTKILSIIIFGMVLCSFTSVNASIGNGGIATYAYNEGNSTFRGSKRSAVCYYDGTFMAVEA